MALNVARLQAAMYATVYAACQEFFGPEIPAGATGSQVTRINHGWDLFSKVVSKGVTAAIIPEIVNHAEVTSYITTADSSLQTSTSPTTPTDAPPADVELSKKGIVT